MPTQHAELAKFVLEKAVLRGEFKLASGRVSDYYIDGKKITYSPMGLQLITEAIRAELSDLAVDAIGGLEIGAIPIATAVALASGEWRHPIPAFIVRKEVKSHGTQQLVEGMLPEPGRVAVVDDVVTTGGSIVKAIETVEGRGCSVAVAIAIVDRLSGATEALEQRGVPYRPLLTIEDLGLSNESVGRGNLQRTSR